MDKVAQKKGQKKRKEMEKMGKEFIMGKYRSSYVQLRRMWKLSSILFLGWWGSLTYQWEIECETRANLGGATCANTGEFGNRCLVFEAQYIKNQLLSTQTPLFELEFEK